MSSLLILPPSSSGPLATAILAHQRTRGICPYPAGRWQARSDQDAPFGVMLDDDVILDDPQVPAQDILQTIDHGQASAGYYETQLAAMRQTGGIL